MDLLESVASSELDSAPTPQRRALEIALLRVEPTGAPPDPRAIATGLTSVLRALASRERLVIAIDDWQWLDSASAAAVTFAARRLRDDDATFLLAIRSDGQAPAEGAFEPLGQLEIGPISIGATRRMLLDRLGLHLPRQTLSRVFDASLGSPMFALERYATDASVAYDAAEQARTSANRMTHNGTPIRLVRSIFLPEDETSLLLFEAASADVVRQAATDAGISVDRVAEAVTERSR